MKYRGLIDSFSRIEAGDLLSCIAVMDEANKILGALSPDERTDKELLHHVIDKISMWMRDGFGEERITERDDLISALEKINSAGDDEEDADYDLVMSFISESQTHLEDIESRLLSMETQHDPELVNGVFRSIHTIKGVSSFLGLPRVKTLSHALETVLDEIRNEKRSVDSELIDILLEGCDRLTAFVDALGVWAQAVEPSRPGRLTEPDVVIQDVLDRLNSLDKSDGPLYTQEMIDNFVQESLEILDSAERALMDLDEGAGRESLNEAFRGIHTIKGNAGFFEQEDVGRFCQSLESVMDGMRQGNRTIGAGAVTGLLDGVDALRVHLTKLSSDGDSGGASQGDDAEDQAPLTLGKVLVDMGAVQPEDVDAALDAQGRRIGEILIDNGVVAESTIQEALNVQASRSRKAESGIASSTKRDVRVDTGRLDLLFTLIGELITAHAMVINNPELDDLELPEFDKASSSMGKIIRDIQTLSMSIRMIPLDGLFSKMRRLSRDLSRKFGKSAEFLSKGEDTEMDRQIIEQISDPLVHLVRNAIDHGLEDKKTRVASGKSESGIIELSARYEGNEVWISVRDDGGGLDREKILSRAG
ncbi:MAG: Hpt domain-containing protein, partial [Spirochaetaceae bacterium]|nr:Hpt domain-containing protein [Spirochaetaceae bacterium]